jgi:hypothetical protein
MPALTFDDMVSRWKARGYSDAGARGMADNMTRESGGDPGVIGDNGSSLGLFQHHGPRKAALEAYAKERGKPATDPDVQIDFADRELRTQYPKLRAQLATSDNRGASEDAFKRTFERPASIMWENNPRTATDKYRFSDYALNEHAKRKNTDILYMPPQDYLDLSPELEGKPFESPSGRSIKASVDRGDEIESIPTLTVDNGKVTEQDGRHRALLAQEHGIDAIPVAVKGEVPNEIEGMSGKVVPQPKSLWRRAADMVVPSAEAAEPANPYAAFASPVDGEAPKPADNPYAAFAAPVDGENPAEAKAEPDKSAGSGAPNDPALPYPDEPGVHRGSIMPFASDDKGDVIKSTEGWTAGLPKLYMPEMFRAPIRGAVAGGQEALGERPVDDPAVRSDIFAAASFGAGAAPAGIVKEVVAKGGEFRPMYEFVSRVVGGDISKNDAALRIVARMEQDAKAGGPTAQDMLDLMNATPDKPLVLGDVVGENGLAYLGKLGRSPGESREIITKGLNDRDMGAGTRLAGDVDKSIATGSADTVSQELIQLRKKAARPFYDAAYERHPINPDEMKPEGSIGSMLTRPSMRSGMANARKIAAEEGVDVGALGIDLDAEGVPFYSKVPTWRTLDYVKRGLDDVVEQYRDKTTGKLVLDTYGNAAQSTRGAYRDVLRNLNPDYAKALDAYSGPSASKDAMKAGQDFLRRRPEEISRRISELSPGDKEFYKLGAADALRTALAKKSVGADETKAIINSQYMRDQLRPLFDNNDAYERFVKSVEAEGRMFGTRYSALGNSRTAAREAEDQSPEVAALANAARGAGAALSHNPLNAIWSALKAGESLNALRNPAINADAARLMMSPLNTPATAGRLNALKDFMNTLPTTRNYLARYAGPSSAMSTPATAIAGNALAGRNSNMTPWPGSNQ